MPYKLLKSLDDRNIILKDTEQGIEFALMDHYKDKCPICHYPLPVKEKKCHFGFSHLIKDFNFITGHYYETDFKGIPNNWFGELLKRISEQPFKHSHELLRLVLLYRINQTDWDLKSIDFATMVPTSNQQMKSLFSNISNFLDIKWINPDDLFIKKELNQHYKERREYVENKYFLKEIQKDIIENGKKPKSIIIFDDVLHQGFTFGRIMDLFKTLSIKKFYLVTIARTTPKTFQKTFTFP